MTKLFSIFADHPDIFKSPLEEENEPPVRIHPEKINELFQYVPSEQYTSSYSGLSLLFRALTDLQFGIKSALIEGEWVRDARCAVPLDKRMSHEHPLIEGNNLLLRCLARLQAIDYALSKSPFQEMEESRSSLNRTLQTLIVDVFTCTQLPNPGVQTSKHLKKLEEAFDTELIKRLHEAMLTEGCETEEDAKQLLFYYRNLSSVLEPAKTLVTLTYDETTGVTHRETQYPVTTKTASQLQALEELRECRSCPTKTERTAHTSRAMAFQEADRVFVDLLKKPDRALPAQARKTHLVGTKNAFVVKNELFQEVDRNADDLGTSAMEFFLGRTGSLVYVGKGETDDRVAVQAEQNLIQLEEKWREITGKTNSLQVTVLNTNMHWDGQHRMVGVLRQICGNLPGRFKMVHVSVNEVGTFGQPSVSGAGRTPFQKATRVSVAVRTVLQAITEGLFSIVHCASGQDRTGTVIEKAKQLTMEEWYRSQALSTDNIETMQALGGNAGEIASHLVPGSPGMKFDSKANDLIGPGRTFGGVFTQHTYRKSANTVVKNPVGDVRFLSKPGLILVSVYGSEKGTFQALLEQESDERKKQAGQALMKRIELLVGADPASLSNQALSLLVRTVEKCSSLLESEVSDEDRTAHLKVVGDLCNAFAHQSAPGWAQLSLALLTFASVALIVAGLLFALPTAGISGVGVIAGFSGLGVASLWAATTLPDVVNRRRLVKDIQSFKDAVALDESGQNSTGPDLSMR